MFERFNVLVLLMLLMVSGCSMLSNRVDLEVDEYRSARDAFQKLAKGQKQCSQAADAIATITIDSTFQKGTLNGYVQTMAPSFLKLVGENPFGQPLFLLTTDGNDFTYAFLAEKKVFRGEVSSSVFRKILPIGFVSSNSHYWLIGRLAPGSVIIDKIYGDRDGAGYWVSFRYSDRSGWHQILFDPIRRVVLRHILEDTESQVLDVAYDGHQSGDCGLPGEIVIKGSDSYGTLILSLQDWQGSENFPHNDFQFAVPNDFKETILP